jgi:ABC-2 type transport system ATP-binding protein
MAILSATNITKRFAGHTALNRVSLNVPEGGIYGLLGPNGAGKTTFIRIINQITGPDQGEILFNGKKLKTTDLESIGYLPEERGLYKKMKVGEQALYLARLKGLDKQEANKRLKFWFEKFDIGAWWDKKVEELSKGMQQKIQFIITIIHDPVLLIFDEPFSGFDPINVNLIKEEILKLKEKGTSIIFSTHNMESVEELCDHIALINKSEKILEGSVKEIKNTYRSNSYEVHFSGDGNDLESILNNEFTIIEKLKNEDQWIAKVKLPEDAGSNVFLQKMINKTTVHSFNEILPTMNDIFIQKVNEDLANNYNRISHKS